MSAESPNATRRKRKPPVRRTPAIIEQRERKPFVFGWGTDLDRRQREALKERIALFAGIAIAAVLVLLLGWGWYHDNISVPAAREASNNRTVAIVGNDTITYGYFMKVANFRKKQISNDLTTLQQQQSQLGSKQTAQSAQINAQISSLQQELGTLPTSVLNNLIDNSTLFQRASSVGVTVTQKDIDKEMTNLAEQAGGIHSLNTYIASTGLTRAEYEQLVKGQLLAQKLQKKLSQQTPHVQTKVHAEHILVSAKNKALAERIYHEVLQGKNFAALAKKYSTDTGSAKKGGDLGLALPSTYVPPFQKAVSTMPVGSVRLVKSQFGWHIIKLLSRKPVRLTSQEYTQAQQSAYTTWLQTQEQSKLHVQRIMDVTKIPGLAASYGSAGNPLGTIPNGAGIPGQAPISSRQNPAQQNSGANAGLPSAPISGKPSSKTPAHSTKNSSTTKGSSTKK